MEDKIKSIFKGQLRKIYYELNDRKTNANEYFGKPYINERHRLVEEKIIHICEVDRPPFNYNETVYINELNLKVRILQAIRTTNGEYLYETDYAEYIEDDETIKSKEEAEKLLEEELIKYNLYLDEEQRKHNKKNKKWYEFWK